MDNLLCWPTYFYRGIYWVHSIYRHPKGWKYNEKQILKDKFWKYSITFYTSIIVSYYSWKWATHSLRDGFYKILFINMWFLGWGVNTSSREIPFHAPQKN